MDTVDREHRFQTVCLMILSIIGVAFALHWLRPIMIPFTLSIFFSFLLTPLIDLQTRYLKAPRALALFSTIIVGIVFLSLLSLLITASITELILNANSYQEKIEQSVQKLLLTVNLEEYGIDVRALVAPTFRNISQNAGSFIGATINAILGLLSRGLLVLIFIIFLLLGKTKDARPYNSTWQEAENRIKKYLSAKFFLSAITGLLVGAILFFLDIDMAIVFGLFAFILNFIPSIGSIIATLLPLPVVLVTPDVSFWQGAMAIGIPGVIQFTIGNIIEPKIMGDSLDLHPVVILMALIFWGMIWGLVGMLLAAPLTAVMKIIFQKMELTAPIANLMAGRLDDFKSKT